jgi:hypothetical protein
MAVAIPVDYQRKRVESAVTAQRPPVDGDRSEHGAGVRGWTRPKSRPRFAVFARGLDTPGALKPVAAVVLLEQAHDSPAEVSDHDGQNEGEQQGRLRIHIRISAPQVSCYSPPIFSA